MPNSDVIERERRKLADLFKDVEPAKAELVSGLIDDAAFLYAENQQLRELMMSTGMVKVHPQYPEVQKPTEAAKQYLRNLNSYAVVIKALNSVLSKNVLDPDDGMDEFE
ncbi:hypothetical protein [Alicyclobacillus sp. ALC3]|uniref:hypothetical protein n=1 Tax=Alicyclobacillus sp. ALC3 TaxID=2796143 RepID=UPI002379939B|nr:hypothetical protein [Alicyclobacillus sp. ALC3]WDL98136.1 hypothetical protein JC200_05390 [Alicyclobacillus sp. ALC3]